MGGSDRVAFRIRSRMVKAARDLPSLLVVSVDSTLLPVATVLHPTLLAFCYFFYDKM